jgi:DNA-directed RNA polymerase specialized sigma24 family protein
MGVAMKVLRHKESAQQDAYSETNIKATAHHRQFQSRTKFRSWIIRILYNTIISSKRKSSNRYELATDFTDPKSAKVSHGDWSEKEALLDPDAGASYALAVTAGFFIASTIAR